MAMPDALAGYGNCCLADQDTAGLRYCPARHLGSPDRGSAFRTASISPALGRCLHPQRVPRAASGPAGLAGLEAEAPSPLT
jgi:hypothetical protein